MKKLLLTLTALLVLGGSMTEARTHDKGEKAVKTTAKKKSGCRTCPKKCKSSGSRKCVCNRSKGCGSCFSCNGKKKNGKYMKKNGAKKKTTKKRG